MATKRIVVDIDGVLAWWTRAFRQLLVDANVTLRPFEDGRDPLLWDWPQHYGATHAQEEAALATSRAQKGWWRELPAHEDFGLEARRLLRELCEDHEVYFVTQRDRKTAETRDWLEVHLIHSGFEVVSTTHRKMAALVALEPDVIIEDRLPTLLNYRTRSQQLVLAPARLILVDRPYNRTAGHPERLEGIERVPSTREALVLAAQDLPLVGSLQ